MSAVGQEGLLRELLPREIIEALDMFMGGDKPAGQVVLDFRNGGCAKVTVTRVLKS